MGSQAEYEARKAQRKAELETRRVEREKLERTTEIMMLDTLDRFVTAVERIADAMEANRD